MIEQFPETPPEIQYARHHYNFLDKINLFLAVYGKLAAAIIRISWWLPFLAIGLFQAVGLAGLVWFYEPLLVDTIYPLLALFLPANIFHYPQYYLVLPSVYSAFENFILGPTLWLIFLGMAVYRLYGFNSGKKLPIADAFNISLKSFPLLLIVWLIETAATLIILYAPAQFLKPIVGNSSNRAMALSVMLQMAALGVSAYLIYAVPGIIIGRRGIRRALTESIQLCNHNFFLTYAIVFIPSFVKIIFSIIMGNFTPRIIGLMNPDLVPGLLLLQIILGIFINLFIYGGAVIIYKEFADRS